MNRSHAFGVVLVLAGGICLSIAGILLRHVEAADGWQILFYRAVSFFVTLFVILAFKYRGGVLAAYREVGSYGVLAGVVLGLGSIAYVFALLYTTVANAVFIIGASPLFAALVGWLWLRERLSLSSVAAMVAAFIGIGLMLADGIVAGRWFGNLMAILVVVSFVLFLVMLRDRRDMDMLPATSIGGIAAALVAGVMAGSLTISTHDLIIAVTLGSVQFTGGFMLLTIGTRYVPAAEVALFSLSEAVLAPIWVWLGVGEVPSRLTLAGASIVFLAVVAYSIIGIRRERARLRTV